MVISNFLNFSFFVIVNLICTVIYCQNSFFNPLLEDSCQNKLRFIKDFQLVKDQLITNEYNLTHYPILGYIDSLPSAFRAQLVIELIDVHLKHNSESWKKEIDNFIKVSLWKKDVLIIKLSKSNLQKKHPKDYEVVIDYINQNYNLILIECIKELQSDDILNQIFWVNAIWQRDQDFRRYFMYNNKEDSVSVEILHHFDKENLKSIQLFIEEYGYPTFLMGTYNLNFAIMHLNNPEILNPSNFNDININIWKSVLLGYTSLQDYCYIIDRYLVTNLKRDPLFGLYYPDNVTQDIIDLCSKNRVKIGLKI